MRRGWYKGEGTEGAAHQQELLENEHQTHITTHHGRPREHDLPQSQRQIRPRTPPFPSHSPAPLTRPAQNKQLSENTDEILKAQGVSWVARKAMGMAVPHLAIAHTPAGTGAGAEELAITIGVQGQSRSERRVLDGAERVQEGGPAGAGAGAVRVANARAPLDALAGGLRAGWLPESFVDGNVVHVRAKGEAGWVMEQVGACGLVCVLGSDVASAGLGVPDARGREEACEEDALDERKGRGC